MTDPNPKDFRTKAEKRLSLKKPLVPEVSPEDAEKLIHELRVHQIELEMQNDELRKAQEEIEVSPAGMRTFTISRPSVTSSSTRRGRF